MAEKTFFLSRGIAAERLHRVAEFTSWGGFPEDITPEEMGEAVSRALINCPIGETLAEKFDAFCIGFWRGRRRK